MCCAQIRGECVPNAGTLRYKARFGQTNVNLPSVTSSSNVPLTWEKHHCVSPFPATHERWGHLNHKNVMIMAPIAIMHSASNSAEWPRPYQVGPAMYGAWDQILTSHIRHRKLFKHAIYTALKLIAQNNCGKVIQVKRWKRIRHISNENTQWRPSRVKICKTTATAVACDVTRTYVILKLCTRGHRPPVFSLTLSSFFFHTIFLI